MSIAVRIVGLLVDSTTEQPVILLQDPTRNRIMPIVIGPAEAGAIASELEHIHFPRPMTHDLLRELLHALGGRLEQVLINDLRDNTFFARLLLRQESELGQKIVEVDARPSDSIALALQAKAEILVAESVFATVEDMSWVLKSQSEGGVTEEE